MIRKTEQLWFELRPAVNNEASRVVFVDHARALSLALQSDGPDDALEEVRAMFAQELGPWPHSDNQVLLAAGLVLSDLAVQGWQIRVRGGTVCVRAPESGSHDHAAEKARVRRQELVKRDAQLRQPSVQKFIQSMEQTRVFAGGFTSIFTLMRDGRKLADDLRRAREHRNNGWAGALAAVVDPYLEFVVSDETRCNFTGLRLMDIWRYFRHTWTNQHTSIPGRTMMFLVRDRAAQFHPVVGIGALSSPVMQIRERDTWIGWHPDTFLARVKSSPTSKLAQWLVEIINSAIAELYIDDLREDGVISSRDLSDPSNAAIVRLLDESATQRRLHHRFARSRDYKPATPGVSQQEHWIERARTHLFRSKRALALASYLRAQATLRIAFGDDPTAEKLAALAATCHGRDTIRKIVKKAKSDRVGIAVADLTVCGAIQPYNAILGGKLLAMLATSPEVIVEYRCRYANAKSEIASSMAGRPIVRTPALVLLGTTSLYGVGSSQYNRIKIPWDRISGTVGGEIRYQELGHSEAYGTSHYSEETVDALESIVQQSESQRVNSIFGEGVSPKLRKVRHGLDLLGFPSELLLRHHRRRIVYAVSLIRNLEDYLLGLDPFPNYFVPMEDSPKATAHIAHWWRERWLRNRIMSDNVLAEVERHTLVRPISHGARAIVPQSPDQQLLFPDPL